MHRDPIGLFWPWGKAQSRIVNGSEDNLWDYYRSGPRQTQRALARRAEGVAVMGARRSGKRSDRMGSQGSDAPGTLKGTLREMRQGTWLKNAKH